MLPPTIIINRSNWAKIYEEGWWIVETIVLPDFAILFKNCIRCKEVVESNPVVGSSKNIIEGLVSNSTPIDTLLFYPPDTPLIIVFPTYVSEHLVRPKILINY